MKRRVLRRLVQSYHVKIAVPIVGMLVCGATAYGLSTVQVKPVAKPVVTKVKPSSRHVSNLRPTKPVSKPIPAVSPPQTPPPAPAPPAPAKAPQVSVPPPPKPAANVTESPAAVANTNTTPGSGVSSLAPTNNSPAPTPTVAPVADAPPAVCANTPGSYASSNWAGYFKTGCVFTTVSGRWTVPTPTSTSTTDISTDAAWIGIGGVNTNDLIQVGTEETVDPDGTINAAVFYELLPDAPHFPTSITVSPGDKISASLNEVSANNWLISITNTTKGQTCTKTVAYTSSHASVEWIEEDPSYTDGSLVPFDDFGSVSFTDASATGNGTSGTLSDASSIKLVDAQYRSLATPGAILGSDSFSVTRRHP
jgi:hypothetical protein